MTDNELLGRIDERTANIYKLVEKQERHLEQLNGTLKDHEKRISATERTGKDNRKMIIGIGSFALAILAAVGGFFAKHIWPS